MKEIREGGVAEELKPAIYRLHEQADPTSDQPSSIVRTSVDPLSIRASRVDPVLALRKGLEGV